MAPHVKRNGVQPKLACLEVFDALQAGGLDQTATVVCAMEQGDMCVMCTAPHDNLSLGANTHKTECLYLQLCMCVCCVCVCV